jgi:hypothetical protein
MTHNETKDWSGYNLIYYIIYYIYLYICNSDYGNVLKLEPNKIWHIFSKWPMVKAFTPVPMALFVGLNQKRLSQRPLLVVSARLHPWPAKQRLLLLRLHLRLIVAVRGMNQEVSWDTPKPRSHLEWLLDTQWSLLQIISNEHPSCPIPIFSYIYIPWASISQEKRVLQSISIFRVKTRFSLAASSAAFDPGLLTGFYIMVFTGYSHIFTEYSRVFDRLAKPVLPPKAGFRCQNRFFLGFRSKTWFLSRNPLFFRIWKSYRYLYIYIINAPVLLAKSPISSRWSNPLSAKRLEPAAKCLMPNLTTGASGAWCSIPSLTPSYQIPPLSKHE